MHHVCWVQQAPMSLQSVLGCTVHAGVRRVPPIWQCAVPAESGLRLHEEQWCSVSWTPCTLLAQGSAGVGRGCSLCHSGANPTPPPSSFTDNATLSTISCNADNPSHQTSHWCTLTCNPVMILSQQHLCRQQKPWGTGARTENLSASIYISPTP